MTERWFCAGLSFSISLFFFYLFYIRFWKWRDCIQQAASSCLTPDGDNLTQGGAVWIVPAILFLGIAALIFLIPMIRKRIRNQGSDR
jgi:hypothetical protein